MLTRGVLDTGADISAVAPRVVTALGLAPVYSAQMHTASGPANVDVYEVSLSVVPLGGSGPLFTVSDLLATELQHAAPGVEVLVGLDVLMRCVFNLNGPGGTFSLTF